MALIHVATSRGVLKRCWIKQSNWIIIIARIMKKVEISVIIPAYNEEKYIGHCLQSLVWQETKHKFEVVVIDNNSKDNTKKVAQSFKKKLNIRVITEKRQGRGIARWRGFEEAVGDFLFSSDADTVFPPNWIEGFMKYFKDKKVVAATSLCDIDDPSQANKVFFKFVLKVTTEGLRMALGHYCLYGYSYAIRKNIYIKAGKIDKTLNALDDIDLGKRVIKYGKIQLIRDIPVLTSNRRYRKGMSRGLLEYVIPFIQLSINKNKLVMDNSR
jgi:glycosyltransferase involved in cell wall biosynthesis